MNFIRFGSLIFVKIITVGVFFILWDIYFAYQNVWGFNDEYLMGIRWFKLPLEEWLFFFLFHSLFQQFYSLFFRIFLPKLQLTKKLTNGFLSSINRKCKCFCHNLDRIYTATSFGLFALLMIFQIFLSMGICAKVLHQFCADLCAVFLY